MKPRAFILIAILLMTGLACQAANSLLGIRGGQEQGVLFKDDFSDPSSGWDRVNDLKGVADYKDDAYRIYVNSTNTDIWSNPGLNFSDVRIEVEAVKAGGDDNNDFGVICRYQDSENFYFLIISSDGYYGIGKMINGKHQLIGMESMPTSDKILQGNQTNRLRAECVGNTLSLYVNGELLTSQEDSDFSSGDVGLIAGTFETPGTDIRFDNFVVSQP